MRGIKGKERDMGGRKEEFLLREEQLSPSADSNESGRAFVGQVKCCRKKTKKEEGGSQTPSEIKENPIL